jgi:hypothetical protein
MEQSTAERRLVKSPPELWAEVSCEDALGRRLAQFGEIRITRLEPETTVAWEGERASGTVELAPAGWGTKVVLTALPAVERSPAAESTPEATTAPPPAAVAVEPATPPAAEERKPGFLARLFRRPPAEPAPVAYRFPPQPDPVQAPAAASPTPPPTAPDPSPPALGPEPTPPELDPAPTLPTPAVASPADAGLDTERTVEILTEVLDDLGAAHHRPFSRDELS